MSQRSQELIAEARERLATRSKLSPVEDSAATVSLAYYAMLYAARALLSERGGHARSHRGTWHLLREELLPTGELERELIDWAQRAQELGEAGDYSAREISGDEARQVLDAAHRSVSRIEALIAP